MVSWAIGSMKCSAADYGKISSPRDGWMDGSGDVGVLLLRCGVAIADGRRKAEQTKLLLRVKTGTLRLPFIITTIFLIPIACANKITVLFGQTKR